MTEQFDQHEGGVMETPGNHEVEDGPFGRASRRSVVKRAAMAMGALGAAAAISPGAASASAPEDWFNVKVDYGAHGDGTTDDTESIAKALAAAKSAGGGIVYFPPGTYITKQIEISSKVTLLGAGIGATILKLKEGSNSDLIHTAEFSTLAGSKTATGCINFAIRHLCLEGNRGGNSAPAEPQGLLAIYGADYVLEDFRIENAAGNGLYSEFGEEADVPFGTIEAILRDFKIANSGGIGMIWNGPHDSMVSHAIVADSKGSAGIWVGKGGDGSATLFNTVHVWGESEYAWRLNSFQSHLTDCQGEGATVAAALLSYNGAQIIGGSWFNCPLCFKIHNAEKEVAGCLVITNCSPNTGGIAVEAVNGTKQVDWINTYVLILPNEFPAAKAFVGDFAENSTLIAPTIGSWSFGAGASNVISFGGAPDPGAEDPWLAVNSEGALKLWTSKFAVNGNEPVAKHAAIAEVPTTVPKKSEYGFTEAQANDILTTLNSIREVLKNVGLTE